MKYSRLPVPVVWRVELSRTTNTNTFLKKTTIVELIPPNDEWNLRLFFSRKVVFFEIFEISRFLPKTADAHTSTSLLETSRETLKQGSNLGAWHRRTSLAFLRRPQQRLLQWLRTCTRRSTGIIRLSLNLCATVAFREICQDHSQYSIYRDTFGTLWASGDAQTHTRRFTPSKLCPIVVSRWVVCETVAQHR